MADYRIGLLASAATYPPGVRWQGGVTYRPIESNIPIGSANYSFYPCTAAFGVDLEGSAPVRWEPFGLALGDKCLAGATDDDEERARAERRLAVQTEYLLGRIFWTGEVAGSTFTALGAPNRPLASTSATLLTTTGPVGVVTGFSLAIQYLADVLGSQRGMIHVPPKLLPFLAFYGVALREGFQVLTAIADHLVIASPGYQGSAPSGEPDDPSTTWVYVTSIVRAAVSEVRAFPALNRSTDEIQTYASRVAIAEWDLQAHASIQICLPDPGPSCLEVPS